MILDKDELGVTSLEAERCDKFKKLYHYTSVDGLKGILDSEAIWTTQIQYMNDSKEFLHSIDIAFQIVKRKKNSSVKGVKKYCEAIEHRLKNINGARTFIFSMTENPDQLSQWRGYCGLGGYSIGFNESEIIKLGKAQNYRLEKCIYDDCKKALIIEKIIDESIAFYKSQPSQKESIEIVQDSMLYSHFISIGSLMKHSSFAEENEWRLISKTISYKDPSCGWRTKDGILLPYNELKLGCDENGYLPISEVYIGPCKEKKLAADSLRVYMQVTNNLFRMRYSKSPYRG
jgi:hypothetical protein